MSKHLRNKLKLAVAKAPNNQADDRNGQRLANIEIPAESLRILELQLKFFESEYSRSANVGWNFLDNAREIERAEVALDQI